MQTLLSRALRAFGRHQRGILLAGGLVLGAASAFSCVPAPHHPYPYAGGPVYGPAPTVYIHPRADEDRRRQQRDFNNHMNAINVQRAMEYNARALSAPAHPQVQQGAPQPQRRPRP